MSERVDFRKLEKEFQPDSIRASRIHKDLESLHTLEEFDDFIETNLAYRMQYLQINKLSLNPNSFTKHFRKSHFLPSQGILRNGRFALLQSPPNGEWEFFGNFNIGNYKYHLGANKNSLNLTKNDRSPQPIRDIKLIHHLLYGLYQAKAEDYSHSELNDLEDDMYHAETSESLIDSLAAFFPSEKVSRSKLIYCPNDCGLIVSKNEKTTKRTDVSDVALNIIQQANEDKMLVYRFETKLNVNDGSLRTSDVTWQLIDGQLDQLSEYEDIDKRSDESNFDIINPARNFEAWKHFMELADDSLVYAIREN